MATEARMEYAAFSQLAPNATAALTALGKAVIESGLDKSLIELIKIRASQVNGCAFCLQFHLNAARKFRLAQTKLDLVAVWRDAGIFSAREMAALGMDRGVDSRDTRRCQRRSLRRMQRRSSPRASSRF